MDIMYSKIEICLIKPCWNEHVCFLLTKQHYMYTRQLIVSTFVNFFPNAEYQFSILLIPIRISILCIIVMFLFFVLFVNKHVFLSLFILIKQHIKHLKIQIYLPVIKKLIYFTCNRGFISSQCVLVNFVLMRYYQVGKRLIL